MPQTGVQNIFLGFNQKAPLANKNLPSACGTRNLARKSAINGGAEYFSWLQSKSSLGKQKFAERLRHAEFGPQVTGSVFWIWSTANGGAEYDSINPSLTTRAAITPRAYHSPTNSGRQTESIFGFLDLKSSCLILPPTEVREGLLRLGLLRSALTDFLGWPPTAVTSYEGL
ncbi:hypothetical protein B0H10DRAFT_1963111 [Mycena sp. CBHHK59/15]|nr:hypothetical protein B0H10DRAFT_1963111 [Mycena sp. CBHHK59/15]